MQRQLLIYRKSYYLGAVDVDAVLKVGIELEAILANGFGEVELTSVAGSLALVGSEGDAMTITQVGLGSRGIERLGNEVQTVSQTDDGLTLLAELGTIDKYVGLVIKALQPFLQLCFGHWVGHLGQCDALVCCDDARLHLLVGVEGVGYLHSIECLCISEQIIGEIACRRLYLWFGGVTATGCEHCEARSKGKKNGKKSFSVHL